jgi:hypothetical protein
MKSIEMIQMEGTFKVRKIFTSRSQIPGDTLDTSGDNPFAFASKGMGATAGNATATSVGILR